MTDFIKTCTSALNNITETFDEYDGIGVHITAKLKKMNPTQQIYAESLIQKVIKKGIN